MATVGGNTRIKTNMDYDSAIRLTQVYKTINDTSTRLLAQHAYDQMGELLQKQLGQLTAGGFLETQAYAYNIRGWLKGINKDYAVDFADTYTAYYRLPVGTIVYGLEPDSTVKVKYWQVKSRVYFYGYNETNNRLIPYFGVLSNDGNTMLVDINSADFAYARVPNYLETIDWYGPPGETPIMHRRLEP